MAKKQTKKRAVGKRIDPVAMGIDLRAILDNEIRPHLTDSYAEISERAGGIPPGSISNILNGHDPASLGAVAALATRNRIGRAAGCEVRATSDHEGKEVMAHKSAEQGIAECCQGISDACRMIAVMYDTIDKFLPHTARLAADPAGYQDYRFAVASARRLIFKHVTSSDKHAANFENLGSIVTQ